jgi:3-isopropylmalate dehydrogenase
MLHKIAIIPGDGTGPEVIEEGVKVLKKVAETIPDLRFEFTHFDYGGERYLRMGETLPEGALDELRKFDAIYLGAIGHPKVQPGILEREILLALRLQLDLYVNLRPIKLYPGVATPLAGRGPEDIDFVVVREASEGLYCGVGGCFKKGTADEVALEEMICTRKGVERIIRYAFEYTKKRDRRKRLLFCGKTNVFTFGHGLWMRTFEEVAREYPDVETEYAHCDAVVMWMVKDPGRFDVIVTTNTYGDIITDLGAAIQGGMGIAGGANINPEGVSWFEPIGGTAPKYTGLGVINPLSAILGGRMMLDHLGEHEAARAIERAVGETVLKMKSMAAGELGMSTSEVGDLVASSL